VRAIERFVSGVLLFVTRAGMGEHRRFSPVRSVAVQNDDLGSLTRSEAVAIGQHRERVSTRHR